MTTMNSQYEFTTIEELYDLYTQQYGDTYSNPTKKSLMRKAENITDIEKLRTIIETHSWKGKEGRAFRDKLLGFFPKKIDKQKINKFPPVPQTYYCDVNDTEETRFVRYINEIVFTHFAIKKMESNERPDYEIYFENTIDNMLTYFNEIFETCKRDYNNIVRLVDVMLTAKTKSSDLLDKSFWVNIFKTSNYNYPVEYVHNRCDNLCSKFKEYLSEKEDEEITNQTTNEKIDKYYKMYYSEKQFISYVAGKNKDKTYDTQIRKFHNAVLNNQAIVSNKFTAQLCSFNETIAESPKQFIRDVLTSKTNKNYYMNVDLAERSVGSYRRFSIDIDCKKYNSEVFTRDVQYLDYYIHSYETFNEHNVYWCIDIAPTMTTTYQEIYNIIKANTTNFSNHKIICWSNVHLQDSKDLSIHIYYPGLKFKVTELYDFALFMQKKVNSVHSEELRKSLPVETYVDWKVYHKSQQMFRLPFSGKKAVSKEQKDRPAINRISNQVINPDATAFKTESEIIEFFTNCLLIPSPTDTASDHFIIYSTNPTAKTPTYKGSAYTTQLDDIDDYVLECRTTDYTEINDEVLERMNDEKVYYPSNGAMILVNWMIEYIQSVYHYQEHRKLRLIFINNCYAIGLNHATTKLLHARLGCNHTNGTNTTNKAASKDVDYICENLSTNCFVWNDRVFGPKHEQFIKPFTAEVQQVFKETVFKLSILKIILRHYFVSINNSKIIFKTIDPYTDRQKYELPKPICDFHKEHPTTFQFYGTNKLQLYKSTLPLLINSNNIRLLEIYDTYVIGVDPSFSKKMKAFDIYPLPYYKGTTKTFKDRPEQVTKMLHAFLDNHLSDYTDEELEERVNYFESAIAYKFQNPAELPYIAFVITTNQGLCKSLYARLLNEINPYVLHNGDLRLETGDFNGAFFDKTIMFYNEAPNTDNVERIKTITTEKDIVINRKFENPITTRNTSLKVFLTNQRNFNYIEEGDRRFVLFRGTNNRSISEELTSRVDYIFQKDNNKKFKEELKKEYFDYLLNLKIPEKYNNFITIPKIPALLNDKEEYLESQKQRRDTFLLFMDDIFTYCHVPKHKKTQRLVINANHITKILDELKNSPDKKSTKDQENYFASDNKCEINTGKKDETNSEVLNLFKDVQAYEKILENYVRDLDYWSKEKEWSPKLINRKLTSSNAYEYKRSSRSSALEFPNQQTSVYYSTQSNLYVK